MSGLDGDLRCDVEMVAVGDGNGADAVDEADDDADEFRMLRPVVVGCDDVADDDVLLCWIF